MSLLRARETSPFSASFIKLGLCNSIGSPDHWRVHREIWMKDEVDSVAQKCLGLYCVYHSNELVSSWSVSSPSWITVALPSAKLRNLCCLRWTRNNWGLFEKECLQDKRDFVESWTFTFDWLPEDRGLRWHLQHSSYKRRPTDKAWKK